MKKGLIVKLLLGIVLIIMFAAMPIHGNGATYGGSGETVYPINCDDIGLVAEQVYMKLDEGDNIDTDCYFHLRNYGPAQEVQIGFPDNRINWGGIRTISVVDLGDGTKPVLTEKKGEFDGAKVFIWRTRFHRGETKIVNVKYQFGMSYADGISGGMFGYILKTGAYWKGVIKRADFYIDLGGRVPLPSLHIAPHNFLYLGDRIEWHFSDLEPDFDLDIRLGEYDQQNITPEMYHPFQAELDDDYFEDEQFYEPSGMEPMAMDDQSKANPEWVKWAKEEIETASLVRNGIYAYHGYIFQSTKWREYFAKMKWYQPDPEFNENMFNAVEKVNIRLTLASEKELQDKLR